MTELGSLTESQLKRLNQLPALKSPAQDDDGDGSRNSEELAAGTNPYDATDQFRITLTTSANGALTIQWSSVPGKSYTIESSETLTGRWAALPDATIRATASSASHSFPVPATTRYYRVSLLRL